MNINVLAEPKEETFLQEEAMDFKVNREIFSTNEVVFDGSNEQAIELDYILPDYFSEIFRVLKCQLSPRVVSHNISGEKLVYELVVGIRVLYISENSNALRSIEQKMNYTKTVDLGKQLEKPYVTIVPKTDYINCRVVNQRRLDFRGAVSIKVKAMAENKQQIITDAFGSNIQLKKSIVSYPTRRLTASKRATIIEDLDLGSTKPAIQSIVRTEATVLSSEQKIITNKLITKGEALISMLYTCENDNTDSLESMQFNVPFSQIVDFEGITDQYETVLSVSVISCEIIPRGSSGETKEVECEMVLLIECVANRYENVEIVTDVYSTTYPCKYNVIDAKLEKKPTPINENHTSKAILEYKEGDISCVYDAWAKVTNIYSRLDMASEGFNFTGSCNFVVIASNENGCPIHLECDVPFEHILKVTDLCEDSYTEPRAMVTSCSYNLTSTNSVEVKAEIKICGYLFETTCNKLISEIEVDDATKKERDGDYALKLYFAESGEDIWEIAKKYSTSIKAIMEENELSNENVSQKGMLLIPIMN